MRPRHVPLEEGLRGARGSCCFWTPSASEPGPGRDWMDLDPAGMSLLFSWRRFAQLWEETGSKHHRRRVTRCHRRPSRRPEKIKPKAWPSDGPYLFHSAHRAVIYVSQKWVEGLCAASVVLQVFSQRAGWGRSVFGLAVAFAKLRTNQPSADINHAVCTNPLGCTIFPN